MSTHDPDELSAARPDFAAIAAWIPQGASVLDLGCGDGSLLRYLKDTRKVRGYGVEINDLNIVACIQHGVNVIQSNLESGLSGFESNAFDYVILSQTLQATRHTEPLMQEMLRVGREGIVSFPNFGHWKNRLNILRGNMPVSIMQVGSAEDVKAYAKKLIDIVGRNGGFVMCTRGVLDETKPENVKAWIEFTKEYGTY